MKVLFFAFALFVSTAVAGSYLFIGAAASAPTIVFLDDFNDVNGTALESHTPVINPAGGGWAKVGNIAEIQGNTLVGKAANPNPLYVANAGVNTGTILLDIVLNKTDSQVNLYLGSTSNTVTRYLILYLPLTDVLQMYDPGGMIYTGSHTLSAGGHNWKAVIDAVNLSFYEDTVLIASAALNVAPSANPYYGFELFHPLGTPATTISLFEVTSP